MGVIKMKIIKADENYCMLSEISIGDCFLYYNDLFMRLSDWETKFCYADLDSGVFHIVDGNLSGCIPVYATVSYEY